MAPHCNSANTPNPKHGQFLSKQMKPSPRPKLLVKKVLDHVLRFFKLHNLGACTLSDVFNHLIACTSWLLNTTKNNIIEMSESTNDEEINFDIIHNCEELYRKFMTNPKLHSPHGISNINHFIYLEDVKKTARYYATFLWNWNLHKKAKQCNKILEYIRRSLYLTIKYMSEEDINIIHTLLMKKHEHLFSKIEEIRQVKCLRSYLEGQVYHNVRSLSALIEVIHHWFLVMPILLEISKCTGWGYIYESQACLLGLDTLYTVFLNLVYKTPQAIDPPDTSYN